MSLAHSPWNLSADRNIDTMTVIHAAAASSQDMGPHRVSDLSSPSLGRLCSASLFLQEAILSNALSAADQAKTSARAKLLAKDVDAIVANPLQTIGADHITATLLLRDGRQLTPPQAECTKPEFARWLLDRIEEIRRTAPSSPAAPGSR